jgi:hypothetical protein
MLLLGLFQKGKNGGIHTAFLDIFKLSNIDGTGENFFSILELL